MKLFQIIRRTIFEISLLASSEYDSYKIYRKFTGVIFGNNVRIIGKIDFGSEPFLITIGDNVTITNGVRFVTHDGGVGIFRVEHPGMNVFGRITVGNNVFIGNNSIILPNISIGDNVVIGVSSIVTKNVPDNVVVAGVPARVIRTTDEYKENSLQKAIFITEKDPEKRKKLILDAVNQKK
jgi:acetyltransferase-like isoleucine patch superfamily enzyme